MTKCEAMYIFTSALKLHKLGNELKQYYLQIFSSVLYINIEWPNKIKTFDRDHKAESSFASR